MAKINVIYCFGGIIMKEFNLNRKNITIIASYLCLTAIFFSIGFFCGKTNKEKELLKEVSANITSSPYASIMPTFSATTSSYRVILEDGELRLYFDEGNKSRLISSEKISEDAYPVSDIATLKKGLNFDTTESAIELMENFIS